MVRVYRPAKGPNDQRALPAAPSGVCKQKSDVTPGCHTLWSVRLLQAGVTSLNSWYLTSWLPHFLLDETRPSYSVVELLPFSIPLLSFQRKCIWSEDKVKDRLSIPFFMGIFGELDHWYHLFVFIYYHNLSKMQDGILYNLTQISFCNPTILLFVTKFPLTFDFGYGMLNMLGRL